MEIGIINSAQQNVYFCKTCGKNIVTGVTVSGKSDFVSFCSQCASDLSTELNDIKEFLDATK